MRGVVQAGLAVYSIELGPDNAYGPGGAWLILSGMVCTLVAAEWVVLAVVGALISYRYRSGPAWLRNTAVAAASVLLALPGINVAVAYVEAPLWAVLAGAMSFAMWAWATLRSGRLSHDFTLLPNRSGISTP